MESLRFCRVASAIIAACAAMAIAARSQSVTTLVSFAPRGGNSPFAPLIEGTDGNLYGTTAGGLLNTYGTVFKITPQGRLTELYSFCKQSECPDGAYPLAPLVLATDGNFYGTTKSGGAHNYGTVFKMANSVVTTLYSFCSQTSCSDGAYPYAGLVQGIDGNLYGTTSTGGPVGNGTVFKITPQGRLTTLYTFCSLEKCADGWQPFAALVQGTDGEFYGNTIFGGTGNGCGSGGCGTIFKITAAGQLTTIYNFCVQNGCTDGAYPEGSLVQGADGNFYGTAEQGGAAGYGTAFKIAPTGVLTILETFCGLTSPPSCSDSALPVAGLLRGTDGNFYGTTFEGGSNLCQNIAYEFGCGTIFGTTAEGLPILHYEFCSLSACADGALPNAGLMQATNGTLYGTTFIGGKGGCPDGCGTVFSLSIGLAPFVITNPTMGRVGTKVMILGSDLNGSTTVTFNGTAAAFTVVSSTEINAMVPVGATSGGVSVMTPSVTLKSNVAFTVVK